jgi:hypothetical protein
MSRVSIPGMARTSPGQEARFPDHRVLGEYRHVMGALVWQHYSIRITSRP